MANLGWLWHLRNDGSSVLARKKFSHLSLNLLSTARAEIRAEVFGYWLKEDPGTLFEHNTYRYDVETLSDGSRIYLLRPARKNKGADFQIVCERFNQTPDGKEWPPSHAHLAAELAGLASISPNHKADIMLALRKIWDCIPSGSVIADLKLFNGDVRAERALLLAKWLFIEQDVTYWTQSGRHMLRDFLETKFGPLP